MHPRALGARRRAVLAAAAAAAVPAAFTPSASAITDVYNGGTGFWSDGFRWTLGRPPNPGEDVQLLAAFPATTISLDIAATNLASMRVEGSNGATVSFQ